MNKRFFACFLSLSLVLLTSCWDRTEIEEIGFILATALDPPENEEELARTYRLETGRDLPKGMVRMTNQVVIPGALRPEGGEGQHAFFNISSTGITNFKTNRNFASRRSRGLTYEHLKVLIINEELVRHGDLSHLMDFFVRDHVMRTDILIFISDGKGNEILQHKLPLEIMPAVSLNMIMENHERAHHLPSPLPIGELAGKVLSNQSYLVPRIVKMGGKGVKVTGAAVFEGGTNRMLGWLGDFDIEGYEWVSGDKVNEVMDAFYGEERYPFTFEIDRADSSISYERKGETNTFTVDIRTEGFFVDNFIAAPIALEAQETLVKLEQAIAEEITYQANQIIKKMQEQFYVDIFQFHDQVKQNDYSYWKEIEKNWDGEGGEFVNAEITVEAEVKIRHFMTIEQLEEE
jgi:spore germination protein